MVIDLHHHLDTLNFFLRVRGQSQGHILSLEHHFRKNVKTILSVPIYVNFYRNYTFLKETLIDIKKVILEVGERIKVIKTRKDLDGDFQIGVIFHIESARTLKQFDWQLEELFELGIRGIIPIHFIDNQFGTSCDDPLRRLNVKKNDTGITQAGLRFINKCNQLGLWLDLTHTTDKSGQEILENADRVMVSHTGIRELVNLPRNKTLAFHQDISKKEGLIGLTPWLRLTKPDYLGTWSYACLNGLGTNVCIGSDFGAPITTKKQFRNIYDIADNCYDEKFVFKVRQA